jgi:CheY-like chemotaxis protein
MAAPAFRAGLLGAALRVLLAHKDPHELDAIRTALESTDCEVVTAVDGADTLTVAYAEQPDVVVVSASLGRMGGFAVSRELKRRAVMGELPEPKIVVLLERAEDGWQAASARADAWLTHPKDKAEIDQVVRGLLGAA